MTKLLSESQDRFSRGIDCKQRHRIVSKIPLQMTCSLKHLLLCASMCLPSCGRNHGSSSPPDDQSHHSQAVSKDTETFPSETALNELRTIQVTPATLKMSVGDFLKHTQEVLNTKRKVMLRIIASPSTFNDLADMMKWPCASMVLPGTLSEITNENDLFLEIMSTIPVQLQYDYSTVFLRCRDDTYFANSRIGD